jgi:hypothetical protein
LRAREFREPKKYKYFFDITYKRLVEQSVANALVVAVVQKIPVALSRSGRARDGHPSHNGSPFAHPNPPFLQAKFHLCPCQFARCCAIMVSLQ